METKEQFTGLKRNAIDKFYTKESVVDFCLEVVKKCIDINKSDLILCLLNRHNVLMEFL